MAGAAPLNLVVGDITRARVDAIARGCCGDPAHADLSLSIRLFDEAHAALWRRVFGA